MILVSVKIRNQHVGIITEKADALQQLAFVRTTLQEIKSEASCIINS
jgi:hypothetical protein